MRQLVILAGGKGTRLSEKLGGLPKALVDIDGTPLLERQIIVAKRYGFTDVVLLVNHGADQIASFCQSRDNWGMSVRLLDDGLPKGTAGAVLAVLDELDDEFLLMYGDTMLDLNLTRFLSFHQDHPSAGATLYLHPNDHPHDSDLVELDPDGAVLAFRPYPHEKGQEYRNLVNAALYFVRKEMLEQWRDFKTPSDFGKDLFPHMLSEGQELRGYCANEYIKDAGTPKRLEKVVRDLRSGRIASANLEQTQPTIFMDRDGTINKEVNHLSRADQFELLPGVAKAITAFNASGYRSVVITNQPVIARGDCSEQDLNKIHARMDSLLGREGAYIDRVYHCPHHPHKGFEGERRELKIDCDCRKPAIGMIDNAVEEVNCDLTRSWLIGDTTRDIQTAKNAGIRSVTVRTGYGGLDGSCLVAPQYQVQDLLAASDFILNIYPVMLSKAQEMMRPISPGAVIAVGGMAHCGKTTWANVMRDAILASGRKAVVLSLDGWIKAEKDRQSGLLGRWDMEGIANVLKKLDNRVPGLMLDIPQYDRLNKKPVDAAAKLDVGPDVIILVEGVVALLCDQLLERAETKMFISCGDLTRKTRFAQEYASRGLTIEQISDLFVSRENDETPIILASKKNTDILLDG